MLAGWATYGLQVSVRHGLLRLHSLARDIAAKSSQSSQRLGKAETRLLPVCSTPESQGQQYNDKVERGEGRLAHTWLDNGIWCLELTLLRLNVQVWYDFTCFVTNGKRGFLRCRPLIMGCCRANLKGARHCTRRMRRILSIDRGMKEMQRDSRPSFSSGIYTRQTLLLASLARLDLLALNTGGRTLTTCVKNATGARCSIYPPTFHGAVSIILVVCSVSLEQIRARKRFPAHLAQEPLAKRVRLDVPSKMFGT